MTQKEALLEVYLDAIEAVSELEFENTPKFYKAKLQVVSLLRKRIDTLNKQIEEYQGKLKRNAK